MGLFTKRSATPQRESSVPAGTRVYAVGDVHGHSDLLAELLEHIQADRREATGTCVLVFLGDYVDRGPDSRAVIERLTRPMPGFQTHFLRGNHDQVLLDFLGDPGQYRAWSDYGANETLLSYAVAPPRSDSDEELADLRDRFLRALPAHHLAFFKATRFFVQIGDYYFVHAGTRPGIPLERQIPEDQMWIRNDFLHNSADLGVTVVHGHTPAERPFRSSRRIGVDTGAYMSGHLTAAVLEGTECRFLQT